MPELAVLTAEPPRTPKRTVATNAAYAIEQYSVKKDSPYWDVVPATSTIPTMAAIADRSQIDTDQPGEPCVYEIETSDADDLLTERMETTISLTQEKLEQIDELIDDVLTDADGTSSRDRLQTVIESPELVAALLGTDSFAWRAAEIGEQFGPIYRVFDLTNHNHGYPVRSHKTLNEIIEFYEESGETLYAVKLLART